MKNKLPKILILIPRIDSSGPSRGAVALSNLLNRNKMSTFIISHKSAAKDPLYYGFNNIKNYFDIATTNKSFFKKIKDINNFIDVKNITHIISFCLSSDFITTFLSVENKIVFIRGNLLKNYFYDFFIFGFFVYFIHKVIITKFKYIFHLNPSSLNAYKNYYNQKHLIIENFIDEEFYKIRKKNINELKFLYVGSLSKRKNVHSLVKFFKEFAKLKSNAILDLYGDGELVSILKNYINKNQLNSKIFLKGHVDNVFDIYQHYDYFLSFSISEGTSRSVLEALYCGLPCLITDADSNTEIIDNGVNGLIFNKNLGIVENFKNLIKIKPQNRSLLKNNYKKNNVYLKLEDFFKNHNIK